MNAQIPLSFPVSASYAPEDFMTLPCNDQAMQWLDKFPDWPYPVLIIYGEEGSGKTHFLNVFRARVSVDQDVIDNADMMFGDEDTEREFFHQFNQAKENRTYILLSLPDLECLDKIALPDLKSRLKAAPVVEILPPDEMDIQAILVKLFHDRQLKIEPGVIAYILPRIERSFHAVHALVEKIDASSMAEKRSVTVPLVRDILKEPDLF